MKTAKPAEKRYELTDQGRPLTLVVSPQNTKTWQSRFGGKRVVLGTYPEMTLAQARDAADAHKLATKAARKAGEADPIPATATVVPFVTPTPAPDKIVSKLVTVSEAYAMYMEDEGDGKSDGVVAAKWRALEQWIEPRIGTRSIGEVTHDDLDEIIEEAYDHFREAGGTGVGANRLHGHIGRFINWCRREGRRKTGLTTNPFEDVRKRAKETACRRALSEREVRWMQDALPEMSSEKWNDRSDIYARIFEILLRTSLRRSNVTGMQWGWIEGSVLTIPAPHMKNGYTHKIWLSPSVLELIGEKPKDAKASDRVFTVHDETTKRALNRLRKVMSDRAAKEGYTIEHWTLHDLRRTFMTIAGTWQNAARQPILSKEIRAHVLAHKPQGVTSDHYDINDYFGPITGALMMWDIWLNGGDPHSLLTGAPVQEAA